MTTSTTNLPLPVLPGIPNEQALCNGTKNVDLLLAVIGGLVNADGIVTHFEIEKVEELLPKILGKKQSQEIEIKVKTLYHILNPPPDINASIVELCNNYIENGFGSLAKINAFSGLTDIVIECHQMDNVALENLLFLYEQLQIDSPDDLSKIKKIIQKDGPDESSTKEWLIERTKSLFEQNKKSAISPLTPATKRFNREMKKNLNRLEQWASSFGSKKLKNEINAVNDLLEDRPFKIVICGEIKQGKSSLFNAILGVDASPVDASIAATGANFKLQYSNEPSFTGQWLSEKHCKQLEDYLHKNKHRPIEAEILAQVEYLKNSDKVCIGSEITAINSLEDIPDYISVDGSFTPLVQEVTYHSPIDILKNGALLVDTPGLNDHVAIRTEFSIEESLTADCIIFVVNAKGRRATEQQYLETLANSGRAVNLLVVVGHVDELPSDRVKPSLEYIHNWLQGICNESTIHLVGCVPMNLQKAMSVRCSGKYSAESDETGIAQLLSHIEQILSEDAKNEIYRKKVNERFVTLLTLAEDDCQRFISEMDASQPDDRIVKRLKNCSEMLEKTCESLYVSVRTRLRDIFIDAERMPSRYVEEVNETKKAALNALEVAIRQRIEELGDTKFAKSEHWDDFDDKIAGVIVQETFSGLTKRITTELDDWREKLKDFEKENRAEINQGIEVLKQGAEGISDACASNSQLVRAAAVINTAMRSGEKIGFGALGGAAGVSGMSGIVLSATSITALANPVTLSITAAALVVYGAIRIFTNVEKLKKNFIEKKIKNCQIVLDEKTAEIEDDLQNISIQIKTSFRSKAEKQYAPIIREARLLVLYNRLYLDVLKKTRDSLSVYMDKISNGIEQLRLAQ